MSSVATAAECGLYLYGITGADEAFEPDAAGVEGAAVEAFVEFGLAALVSRLPTRRLRASDPISPPTTACSAIWPPAAPCCRWPSAPWSAAKPSCGACCGTAAETLAGLLERLTGRVEMGLKVYWETANIFEYFVATHQELETMRNRLFRNGRQSSVDAKIELGRLFSTLLEQSRRRHTQRVSEALTPYSVEVRPVDLGEERMVMKLACLVEADRQPQWEEGVYQAARQFDDHYRFEFNGPWPPYNFAHVDLRSVTSEE